ncbi:hypothetical protein AVEN_25576-1 [Araneus ventricosus]|uniref:Uncharacterized protein n=1 Tax=Araneus ventricosus TaxID=182803 RepID=A0A4Y2W1K2_ARAVE|nr:hypothetical protein AVEN_25576-1 [Araneus ventricosus]
MAVSVYVCDTAQRPLHRVRRQKRQFDYYENQDEPVIDAKEKYKIEYQDEPIIDAKEKYKIEYKDEPIIDAKEKYKIEYQDEPVIDAKEKYKIEYQDEPVIDAKEKYKIEYQDEPIIDAKEKYKIEYKDEPIIDAKEKYKIELFYHLVDTAINFLEHRFSQLQHHKSYFCFLYHIYELKVVSFSVILANCKDLETFLTDGESSDINRLELCDEISVVCSLLEKRFTTFGSFEIDNKNEFFSKLEHCSKNFTNSSNKCCIRGT